MSLLKNIWRPDEEPPRKGAGPHGDTVLTDRLAALLGRELDELQESSTTEAQNMADRLLAERESREERIGLETQAGPRISVDAEETPREPRRPAAKPPSGRGPNGDGVATIARATEEAIEQLRQAQEQIESSLRERVEDYGRALETALNGIEHGASATSEKPIEEAAHEFRSEARQWFDEARRELRDQLDLSRSSLADELKKHYTELLDAAQAKIDQMTRSALESGAPSTHVEDGGQIESWVREQAETSRTPGAGRPAESFPGHRPGHGPPARRRRAH